MTVCHSSTHVAAVHLEGKRGRVARLKSIGVSCKYPVTSTSAPACINASTHLLFPFAAAQFKFNPSVFLLGDGPI